MNSMWTRGTAACGWAAASTAPTSSIRRPRAGSSPCMRRASPRRTGWPGGVMYQIFPDRFCCSGRQKQLVPADRTLRRDWGGEPWWKPNEKGEVTNSDYFGGDLRGIEQKLPYLKSLGVTCLYLNPIFEAHSNHRYNTANYARIDPLLGTEEDFRSLCASAKKLGIRILLDGVFSHTGSDSVYFNREGRYPALGAYQSKDSPYYPWYSFRKWPDDYESWVGLCDAAERERDKRVLQRIHQRGKRHRALVAQGGRLRLAARRGGRAARRLPGQPARRRQAAGPAGHHPGRGVGGRLHEIRLRPAPPLSAGPPARQRDELSLPRGHSRLTSRAAIPLP